MNSIKETVSSEIEIHKSVFINYVVPVNSVEHAQDTLAELRQQYPDANHHCYAYIIGEQQDIQKYSDDGEPSKTAGMPMIEVLKKQDLTNILTVSIRYFGGIKLGAGGLVRAYTKSVSETLKHVIRTSFVSYSEIEIIIPFDQIGNVEKYIRDHFLLLDTKYTSHVRYLVECKSEDVEKLMFHLTESTKGVATITVNNEYKRYE